jgi:hypothetical protein
MSGKAHFLDQPTFMFDVMDVKQDNQLDLDEVRSVLASLAGAAPNAVVDAGECTPFHGQPVTPLMYLRTFVRAFVDAAPLSRAPGMAVPASASLCKADFAALLQTHPASELLTRPFRMDLHALFEREHV